MLPGNISLSQVRSVMIFGTYVPPLLEFKFLRVLHVGSRDGEVDLTGLSKLYQLRYLKVSCYRSYELPTQIRGLHHLETFDVWYCQNAPSDIVHLPRLSFLALCRQLPDGIENMKALRHLHVFDLGRNSIDNIEGLGQLTNLRQLTVRCHTDVDWERRMDVLFSSLGKIYSSLEYLELNMAGCMDALMALSPPPRCLERLIMGGWFSRVPKWMGELRYLGELKLVVAELPKDGVGVLAELPSLLRLKVGIKVLVTETIVIYETTFPTLKYFELQLSSASYLSFQVGAMPTLQRLVLEFNTKGSEQKGDIPAGIEHLSALKEIYATIGCEYATESDQKTSIESALRSAIDMHPTHPHVAIRWYHCLFDFEDSQ